MTLFLVLGLFAGLYMLWLLFSLAVYALPVATGISLAFWMHDHGQGYPVAILGGFVGGVAVLVAGQLLFAYVRSPLLRLGIALLFAVPAGVAGYHAVYGIAGLAIDPGIILSLLSWVGAVMIAGTAWMRLSGEAITGPASQSTAGTSISS
jgi:hypothetical protein